MFTDLVALGNRSMALARCDTCWQHMLLHKQTHRQQVTASGVHSAGPGGPAAGEAASHMRPPPGPTCAMNGLSAAHVHFTFL